MTMAKESVHTVQEKAMVNYFFIYIKKTTWIGYIN